MRKGTSVIPILVAEFLNASMREPARLRPWLVSIAADAARKLE